MVQMRTENDVIGVDFGMEDAVLGDAHPFALRQNSTAGSLEQYGTESCSEANSKTHSRLEDESVFPDYRPRPTKLSGSWISLLRDGNKKYPLRDIDRSNFRGTCWLDADDTGNYDPNEEYRQAIRPDTSQKQTPDEPNDITNLHSKAKRLQSRPAADALDRPT